MPAPHRVHSMLGGSAPADWPPITDAEAASALSRFAPAIGGFESVRWRSPRPFSSAVIVGTTEETVVLKRHHPLVRDAPSLQTEHAFAAHIAGAGLVVPAAWRTEEGGTALRMGGWVYELQTLCPGIDAYREAESWTPYRYESHARSAGETLARAHLASSGFTGSQRSAGPLLATDQLVTSDDLAAEGTRQLKARPLLRRAVEARDLRSDLEQTVGYLQGRVRGRMVDLPRCWAHNDLHPSNLTWTGTGRAARVEGIFDLGSSNEATMAHDLAIAIERSCIDWLELASGRNAKVDVSAAKALVAGYSSVRELTAGETEILADLVTIAHIDWALAEVEYFGAVLSSARRTELAYEGYLLGHCRWWLGDGAGELERLRGALGS